MENNFEKKYLKKLIGDNIYLSPISLDDVEQYAELVREKEVKKIKFLILFVSFFIFLFVLAFLYINGFIFKKKSIKKQSNIVEKQNKKISLSKISVARKNFIK